MSKQEIEIKTVLGREDTSRYLQELAQCLAGGRIVVQRGGEYVELRPQNSLELEIGAARKKDKEKITLELSWRMEASHDRGCDLKISADTPAAPAPAEPEAMEAQPPASAPSSGEGESGPATPAESPHPEKNKAAKGCRK